MKTKVLYKVFIVGIVTVVVIFSSLHYLEPKVPHENSGTVPSHSALNELEFESGALAKRTRAAQEAKLARYSGDEKHAKTVEVPLTRAIDEYLNEHSTGGSK